MGRVTFHVTPSAASTAPLKIGQPKGVHISAAENGFVVYLNKMDSYEQSLKIAKTPEEVTEILSAYFAPEGK